MTREEALEKHLDDQWTNLVFSDDSEQLDFLQELADQNYLQISDIFYLEYMEDIINRYFSDQFDNLS